MSPLDLQMKSEGFDRIGRIDAVGRRSLWMKIHDDGSGAIELRAGREGDDSCTIIYPDSPCYRSLKDTLETARFAAEWEHPNGTALDVPDEPEPEAT